MTEKITQETPARIDWDAVRSRLLASEHALEQALTESPERIDAAYRLRAERLAKTQAISTTRAAALPVLAFRLGQERYAIELKEVAEALPLDRCTPVPGPPSPFAGVMNVRGELVGVLELARLLSLPASGARPGGEAGFVLLLRRGRQEIGLRVDSIDEVREIRPEELSLPGDAPGKFVAGVAPGSLLLLNADAVLAEVFSHEEV